MTRIIKNNISSHFQKSVIKFFICIIVVVSAIIAGRQIINKAGVLLDSVTLNLSSHYLFHEIAEPLMALKIFLSGFLLPVFFRSYIVGIYLVLIPGMIVAIFLRHLTGVSFELLDKIKLLGRIKKIVFFIVLTGVFVIIVYVAYVPLKGVIIPFDEISKQIVDNRQAFYRITTPERAFLFRSYNQ